MRFVISKIIYLGHLEIFKMLCPPKKCVKAAPELVITSFTFVSIIVKVFDMLFLNIVQQKYYIVKSTIFLVQHYFPAEVLPFLE